MLRRIVPFGMLLILAACSYGAKVSNMAVTETMVTIPLEAQGTVTIAEIRGGGAYQDYWTSPSSFTAKVRPDQFEAALKESLKANDLLSRLGKGSKYFLYVRLVGTRQPSMKRGMKVTAAIEYTVREHDNEQDPNLRGIYKHKNIFQKMIVSSHTVGPTEHLKVSHPFPAKSENIIRLFAANEGAMRKNIAMFLEAFSDYLKKAYSE